MTDDELAAIARARPRLTIVNQILSPLSHETEDNTLLSRLTFNVSECVIANRMLTTRFICARKSWHVDHRGEIRYSAVAAVTFAIKTAQRRSHICN